MYTTLVQYVSLFVDFLFPKGKRSERNSKRHHPLEAKTRHTLKVHTEIISLASYQEEAVKDAVVAMKFERDDAGKRLLAGLLDDFLIEEVFEGALETGTSSLIIPIPLGKKREQERGYNQVTEVVQSTRSVKEKYVRLEEHLLLRTKETVPQTQLSKEERLINVRGVFVVDEKHRNVLNGAHVFLVDDVTTTGATLAEAKRVLEEVGARVTALAFARA